MDIDYTHFPSPTYIIDERRLRKNLEVLKYVQEHADIEIILALKGFAMWAVFPLIKQYVYSATASSLYEAKLCFEELGAKAHTYCVAFRPDEFEEITSYSSHITFNSLSQFRQWYPRLKGAQKNISTGLRVNPGYSDVVVELYNPSASGSRLGVPMEFLSEGVPLGVEGLHFHALCESDAESLTKLLASFESSLGHLISNMKWINMGGGHLITKKGYQVQLLIDTLIRFKEKYGVKIFLEPGSAIAWETGELLTTVLDVVSHGGVNTVILDASFTAHMPDTLEMPYKPRIRGAKEPVFGEYIYRIGGLSCLAGDYMPEYGFSRKIQIGDRLVFEDMMHYTMVKTTMFNGLRHPSIGIIKEDGTQEVIRTFTYEDYKGRLS